MSEEKKWLSITAIERATGIPTTTIRRYLTNHGHHFEIKNDGKMVRVSEESIALINYIRDSYKAGLQKDEIELQLAQVNETTHTKLPEAELSTCKNCEETMEEMNQIIRELKEKIEKQKELLSDVVHMMGRTSKEKDDEIKLLHQKIDLLMAEMTIMREELEAHKQVAAGKWRKKTWYKQIFGA